MARKYSKIYPDELGEALGNCIELKETFTRQTLSKILNCSESGIGGILRRYYNEGFITRQRETKAIYNINAKGLIKVEADCDVKYMKKSNLISTEDIKNFSAFYEISATDKLLFCGKLV